MLAWLLGWSLGFTAVAQGYYDLPNVGRYATNSTLATIDFDGDGQADVTYFLEAPYRGGGEIIVATGLTSDENTSYLASAKKLANFSPDEAISSANKPFKNIYGFIGFDLEDYQWALVYFSNGAPHYAYVRLDSSEFPTLTNVLVGLRFLGGDGKPHHAWIRFTRPDSLLGTLFQVASYGHNPLPDEPIQAGLPAPVPPVAMTVGINGDLVLSWAAKAVPYYKLQTRPDLDPATGWTDVDIREEHIFSAPFEGEQAYYRLTQR